MKASRKRPHARRPLTPVRTRARRGSVARAASQAARPHAQNNISQWLSLYSLTSSQAHSALSILASIVVVANSAFAFAAFGRGITGAFIFGLSVYLASLLSYGGYVRTGFEVKKKVCKMITEEKNIHTPSIVNDIECSYRKTVFWLIVAIFASSSSLGVVFYNLFK